MISRKRERVNPQPKEKKGKKRKKTTPAEVVEEQQQKELSFPKVKHAYVV